MEPEYAAEASVGPFTAIAFCHPDHIALAAYAGYVISERVLRIQLSVLWVGATLEISFYPLRTDDDLS